MSIYVRWQRRHIQLKRNGELRLFNVLKRYDTPGMPWLLANCNMYFKQLNNEISKLITSRTTSALITIVSI